MLLDLGLLHTSCYDIGDAYACLDVGDDFPADSYVTECPQRVTLETY